MQLRNPLAVGGSYNATTFVLTVTFDERIQSENLALAQMIVEGTPTTRREQNVNGTIVGRRVSWPTLPGIGANMPPLRVSYTPGPGQVVGIGGGTVAAFAGLPLALT